MNPSPEFLAWYSRTVDALITRNDSPEYPTKLVTARWSDKGVVYTQEFRDDDKAPQKPGE